MAARGMITQPVSTIFQRYRFELRGRHARRDRGIVNLNDRREIGFSRIPDLRFAPRRSSSARLFCRRRRTHAAGKNAFSKVG